MALKQPYGSGLAAGRLRESRAVRPGSRTRGGRVDGQAGELGMGASSSRTVTGVAAPFIVGFVVVISAQEALQRATAS